MSTSVTEKPEYYAAAAGWRLHTDSDGKFSLLPATRFANDFKLEVSTQTDKIPESPETTGANSDTETQPA